MWYTTDKQGSTEPIVMIELPADLVMQQSQVIERAIEDAFDTIGRSVVCIHVRETSSDTGELAASKRAA